MKTNSRRAGANKVPQSLFVRDNYFPKGTWEWLIVFFIVGTMTISEIRGLSQITILYGILLSGLFVLYFLYRRIKLRLPPEVIIYFAWIVWSLGGMLNMVDETLYFKQLMTVIQMWVLIILISEMAILRRNLSFVMFAIILAGIILGIHSLIIGEIQRVYDVNASARAESIAGNSNAFSYYMLFMMFAVFYYWVKQYSLQRRVLLLTVIFLIITVIVATGSRKTFACALIFVFLWWFYSQNKKLPENPFKLFIILMILLPGIYLGAEYVMSNTHLGKRYFSDPLERGAAIRSELYDEGFTMLMEYPFFGVGLNNYRAHSSSGKYSHSDYIEVASSTGIIGFIMYFSIYLVLWYRLNRIRILTNDAYLIYVIDFLKATILTILLMSLGGSKITIKITWVYLAGVIGYSWSIEQALLLFNHNEKKSYHGLTKRYLERM